MPAEPNPFFADRRPDPDRRRRETETFIAGHSFRLFREHPDAPFSHAAVAQAPVVSARTAYRYFPMQSDLVAAVWHQLRDSTGPRWPMTDADILPCLRALSDEVEQNDALTHAILAAIPLANHSAHGSAEGRAAIVAQTECTRQPRPAEIFSPKSSAAARFVTCAWVYCLPNSNSRHARKINERRNQRLQARCE